MVETFLANRFRKIPKNADKHNIPSWDGNTPKRKKLSASKNTRVPVDCSQDALLKADWDKTTFAERIPTPGDMKREA